MNEDEHSVCTQDGAKTAEPEKPSDSGCGFQLFATVTGLLLLSGVVGDKVIVWLFPFLALVLVRGVIERIVGCYLLVAAILLMIPTPRPIGIGFWPGYDDEAIPVIGNLRTKIGLYQYEKGVQPNDWATDASRNNVQTWMRAPKDSDDGLYGDRQGTYLPATYKLDDPAGVVTGVVSTAEHFSMQIDIDVRDDLIGRRFSPTHYHYYAISAANTTSFAYAVGCFGDGDRLDVGVGKGYAVCELNYPGAKYLGTWRRYSAKHTECPESDKGITFTSDPNGVCYVPSAAAFEADVKVFEASKGDKDAEPELIGKMREAGWEF